MAGLLAGLVAYCSGRREENHADHAGRPRSAPPRERGPRGGGALRDIEAAMVAILAMPFVDRDRVVIGGQSRGGILSVAYGGLHGEQVKGVINFVGGWSGSHCMSDVNPELFEATRPAGRGLI